jgi:hypothetical protein
MGKNIMIARGWIKRLSNGKVVIFYFILSNTVIVVWVFIFLQENIYCRLHI